MPLRYSHHASLPWPFTGGGSGRVSRPSGRRRSPCDQWLEVGAALLPQSRGVVVSAGVLARWQNGRRAGRSRASRAAAGAIRRLPRCARRQAPYCNWHTQPVRVCLAAAHRRRPSLRRWLARERRRRQNAPPAAARRVKVSPSEIIPCVCSDRSSALVGLVITPSLTPCGGERTRYDKVG